MVSGVPSTKRTLTMATRQLTKPIAPRNASRRSTTLRPGIRAQHVYADGRDGRFLAETRVVVHGCDHPRGATRPDAGRFLTTVLITDIVESTPTAARLGDSLWRALLGEHYADCRALVARGRGDLVKTTGDGIVATFGAPACAVRGAIAIEAAARRLGIAVRAGVHTGECERQATDLAGLAVHITERVCALARANEVLTTATVRDLVVGSLLDFEPRGSHTLRGVPREWDVFSATDPS
jgi:class 3 adenylate cyclase